MSSVVLLKLIAIFAVIGVGWTAGRTGVLGPHASDTLTRLAFFVLAPALLFHTTAAIAVAELPWTTLLAYFVPTTALFLAGYAWQRWRHPEPAAGPAVRALAVTFSNTVQVGIPVVTALFGPAGLTILVAIISLHAVVLLTLATALAEHGLGRAENTAGANGGGANGAGAQGTGRRLVVTVRRSLIHPVVLPIALGLAYHATGWPVPPLVDDVLGVIGSAVVPVSLLAIGLSLHQYGVVGSVGPAARLALTKLVGHPALVGVVAAGVFGLRGLPLVIAVLCAALPTGANVLIFAGRYEALPGLATATIVLATVGFMVTVPLWLALLSTVD